MKYKILMGENRIVQTIPSYDVAEMMEKKHLKY